MREGITGQLSGFLFAQRSGQTRQAERSLNHPD